MNHNDIPTDLLLAAARRGQARRLGDFEEPFIDGIRPATSMPMPPGPADFPISKAPDAKPTTVEGWLGRVSSVLERILEELIRQNTPSRAVIRSMSVDNTGETLDWTAVGIMDRLMIRNKGTDSLWFSFDMNGQAVNPFTSDLSFELQANESVNLTHCQFQKIGVRCASAKTATVHAIGFQSVAGNQAAAIS